MSKCSNVTFTSSSERFNTLARGLSPAYLRVGGNAADFLVFRKELGFKSRELDSQLFDENYDGNLGFRNITEFNMSGMVALLLFLCS